VLDDFEIETPKKEENKITVSEFLDNENVNYASYSTLRAIASLVDGLKNSHRKVVHYMQNNGDKEKKLFNLSGEIMTATEYLHGNIAGSVITLAQNFVGSNNIPLLTREGNFGSRFAPEASAERYIYTQKEKVFDKIFKKEDNPVLIEQVFEETKIEPRFFVPTIPLILVNGSSGIATGFAQNILPRKLETIKEYIINYLDKKPLPELKPYFNSFDGIIEKGASKNQWIIKGKIEKSSLRTIIITEIPIGYNLKSYTKVLDDLEEKKIIREYTDLSENDKFKFKVRVDKKIYDLEDDEILEKLKLIKKVTENFTVIDETNRIKMYKSPEEVINHYIKIKLQYLNKRKEYILNKIDEDIKFNNSKFVFISKVLDGSIIINNKNKQQIIEQIEKILEIIKVDNSYEYLLRMQIFTLTKEKIEELKNKIQSLKNEKETLKNTSIENIWEKELEEI
jgi:DNA topoisomerase-2